MHLHLIVLTHNLNQLNYKQVHGSLASITQKVPLFFWRKCNQHEKQQHFNEVREGDFYFLLLIKAYQFLKE